MWICSTWRTNSVKFCTEACKSSSCTDMGSHLKQLKSLLVRNGAVQLCHHMSSHCLPLLSSSPTEHSVWDSFSSLASRFNSGWKGWGELNISQHSMVTEQSVPLYFKKLTKLERFLKSNRSCVRLMDITGTIMFKTSKQVLWEINKVELEKE